jgi:hypothetical protein
MVTNKVLIPIIRRVVPELLAQAIVGVSPMVGPKIWVLETFDGTSSIPYNIPRRIKTKQRDGKERCRQSKKKWQHLLTANHSIPIIGNVVPGNLADIFTALKMEGPHGRRSLLRAVYS